ncbi:MAG TPA: metalloregulator ArsR/SmtB family transcription factor [Candidatus Aquicultor sp.]
MAFDDLCAESVIDVRKVERIKSSLIGDRPIDRLADTFKVLSDPTRVKIVFSLLQGELCVCEIAEVVGASQSAVSHQLRKLKDARLVKRRKASKMVYYSLDDAHIIRLLTECMHHVQEEFHEPASMPILENLT